MRAGGRAGGRGRGGGGAVRANRVAVVVEVHGRGPEEPEGLWIEPACELAGHAQAVDQPGLERGQPAVGDLVLRDDVADAAVQPGI